MSSDQTKTDSSEPSILSGHVKYVQGAVSSLLGNESGEETKKEAVDEMRDAKAQNNPPGSRPAQSNVLGTVENLAGQAVGCEGMEKEGTLRTNKAGPEEMSGTG